MVRALSFPLALCVLLAGCAGSQGLGKDDPGASVRAPDKCKVKVSFDEDDEITVDHEPVRVKRCAGSGRKVVWSLDGPDAKGWSFHPTEGIAMKVTTGVARVDCAADGPRYSCTFTQPSALEKRAYTIKLVKSTVTRTLDPTVFND